MDVVFNVRLKVVDDLVNVLGIHAPVASVFIRKDLGSGLHVGAYYRLNAGFGSVGNDGCAYSLAAFQHAHNDCLAAEIAA